MPIFVERFLLPLFAALVVVLGVTNPMSFDLTQRIAGGIAVVAIAYFCAHTIYKQAPQQQLFAVDIFSDTLAMGHGGNWLWWVDNAHTELAPIDALLAVRIVNTQSVPVEIDSFSFEMLSNNGWKKLHYMPLEGATIYAGAHGGGGGVDFEHAIRVTITPKEISEVLQNSVLEPHKPIRVTAFFQFPKDFRPPHKQPIPKFRITLRDTSGHVAVTELAPVVPDPNEKLEQVKIDYTGTPLNLSRLMMRPRQR